MGAKDTFWLSPVDEHAPMQQLDFLLEILGNSVLWWGAGVWGRGDSWGFGWLEFSSFIKNGQRRGEEEKLGLFESEKVAELPEGRWIIAL
jgi:hypothetical protein